MRSWLALNLALLYLIHLAGCYPHLRHQWESRQVEFDAVADDYDYTIAGGGQSGLVVANCLSENNTDSDSTNLQLLTRYRVNEVLFGETLQATSVNIQPSGLSGDEGGFDDVFQAQSSFECLPKSHTAEQLAGFDAQRNLLADSMGRTVDAVAKLPIHGGPSLSTIGPNSQYDRDICPIKMQPGTSITTPEGLEVAVRNFTPSTICHLSGMCGMAPKNLGRVIGTDTKVYGVTGLSVVDAAVMTLISAAHLCSTGHAVAEEVGSAQRSPAMSLVAFGIAGLAGLADSLGRTL
ncbi:putative GMC oxidoreductase protein [Seiridium cardinale]